MPAATGSLLEEEAHGREDEPPQADPPTTSTAMIFNERSPPDDQANSTRSVVSNESQLSSSNGSAEYLQSLTLSTPNTETTSSSSSSANDSESFTDGERDRLRLMHHYVRHTAKSLTEVTIPDDDQDHSMWGDWVTELALEKENDFLLHAILSLSALHLALRGVSRQRNILIALHHHGLGVALIRPHVSAISVENYDVVFAFSCIVAFYSFGIRRIWGNGSNETNTDTDSETNDTLAKIQEVLIFIRRTSVIVKVAHEARDRSPWSRMLIPYPFQNLNPLPSEIEDMLSTLLRRVSAVVSATDSPSPTTTVLTEVYTSAIQALRDNLSLATTYRQGRMTMTWFLVVSPAEFWELMAAREPLALAILANYAVVLYWQRRNIWLAGWGTATVEVVRRALSPDQEWQDCIAWAVRETEGGG